MTQEVEMEGNIFQKKENMNLNYSERQSEDQSIEVDAECKFPM